MKLNIKYFIIGINNNNHFNIFQYLRFIIVLIIIFFSLVFMLMCLPSYKFKLIDVLSICIIGSFVISLLLISFNIFIDYYSKYDKYYGPLSTLVSVLVLFKFISNIIMLLLFIIYKKYKNASLLN